MQNRNSNPPSILMLEDDYELGQVMSLILSEAGYSVIWKRDGIDALPSIADHQPDLVMLDMHMPNLSGLEILQQIRTSETLAQTKVLVTTADIQMATVAESMADVVFTKPFSIDQLINMVSRLSA
ncbi:MAG: response regulator transcription factor [Anaerolineae bacterium]|nr:response regulator transcription factor [Anaerolineae bacterium]